MKRHLFLIPLILTTTAAIADAQTTAPSVRADAQAQAAALLSRPQALRAAKVETRMLSPSTASSPLDAHASAAALLSGARTRDRFNTVAKSTGARVSTDAQAQAAALLSGSRSSTVQSKRTDAGERTIGSAL